MAALSALVEAIADVQGLDGNQVLWVARYLREAGLLSQGGRGRGGARMTIADASNLLIGVNAPGNPKHAAAMVDAFREMPLLADHAAPSDHHEWDALRSDDDPLSVAFRRNALFGSGLEYLLKPGQADVGPDEEIRVRLSGPLLGARIYIGALNPERLRDITIDARFSKMESFSGALPDQEISKTFTHRTLAEVGRLIAT